MYAHHSVGPPSCNAKSQCSSPDVQRHICEPFSASASNFDMLMRMKWNGRSGWEDTKANAAWDARQKAYISRWKRSSIFTPQLIIDGVADGTGRNEGTLTEVLSSAIQVRNESPLAVGMELAGSNQIKIASMTTETEVFDVVVISYDKKAETVKVGKGPNKGKKMLHMNVVKGVTKIDEWAGGPKVVALPDMSGAGLEHVVVLQQGLGGMIVAACKL